MVFNVTYISQIESFRTRLTAVTKEKYENEEKVIRLSEEIEKKVKLVESSSPKVFCSSVSLSSETK